MSPHEPSRREPVEVRRLGDLVRGTPAERVVRAVGEPVEEDDEDRIHGGVRLQPQVSREAGWLPMGERTAVDFYSSLLS